MLGKTLLFDLDGTLTDPMQGITRSVQHALRQFGIEVTDPQSLCSFIGPPLKESFRERYGFTDTQADEAIRHYRSYFAPKGIYENRLYPHIPEMLAALQAAGATLAIATSKPEPFARRIAEHFGFAERFAFIGGATLDGRRTTKSEVIRHTLDALHIHDPASVVMIGDRRHDIEGAAATGCEAIGVLWGYGSREELENAGATRLAADPRELPGMLLKGA